MKKEFTVVTVIVLLLTATGLSFRLIILSGLDSAVPIVLTALLSCVSAVLIAALTLVSRRTLS